MPSDEYDALIHGIAQESGTPLSALAGEERRRRQERGDLLPLAGTADPSKQDGQESSSK